MCLPPSSWASILPTPDCLLELSLGVRRITRQRHSRCFKGSVFSETLVTSTEVYLLFETFQIIEYEKKQTLGQNDTGFSCDGTANTFRVMFKEPIEILPNVCYTACATLKVRVFQDVPGGELVGFFLHVTAIFHRSWESLTVKPLGWGERRKLGAKT